MFLFLKRAVLVGLLIWRNFQVIIKLEGILHNIFKTGWPCNWKGILKGFRCTDILHVNS